MDTQGQKKPYMPVTLDDERIAEIRQLHEDGNPYHQIARQLRARAKRQGSEKAWEDAVLQVVSKSGTELQEEALRARLARHQAVAQHNVA